MMSRLGSYFPWLVLLVVVACVAQSGGSVGRGHAFHAFGDGSVEFRINGPGGARVALTSGLGRARVEAAASRMAGSAAIRLEAAGGAAISSRDSLALEVGPDRESRVAIRLGDVAIEAGQADGGRVILERGQRGNRGTDLLPRSMAVGGRLQLVATRDGGVLVLYSKTRSGGGLRASLGAHPGADDDGAVAFKLGNCLVQVAARIARTLLGDGGNGGEGLEWSAKGGFVWFVRARDGGLQLK